MTQHNTIHSDRPDTVTISREVYDEVIKCVRAELSMYADERDLIKQFLEAGK